MEHLIYYIYSHQNNLKLTLKAIATINKIKTSNYFLIAVTSVRALSGGTNHIPNLEAELHYNYYHTFCWFKIPIHC